MKLNDRLRGKAETSTLRLALCAIIGAAWIDSEQNFTVTKEVVRRLLYVMIK